jgi:lipopolysaccharide/colanic/teichoic acid biosynthesis glycosyltransferase
MTATAPQETIRADWLGEAIDAARPTVAYHVAKRVLDVVGAAVLLMALAPLLVVVALLIKLDSPGPVVFVQRRVTVKASLLGRRRSRLRTFRMVKFRTMRTDADPSLHEAHIRAFASGALAEDTSGRARFKLANDDRITRVGRYLRRTSLDELPQLFNVLLGEMSLVGPRPLPLYEVAQYGDEARERFLAVPGITGQWQVSGRCDLSFTEMVAIDVEYVRHRSLLTDLRILALTLPAVLSGRGAG